MTMIPIEYRDFWDVPRVFVARHRGLLFLFDCPFDEAEEDYANAYCAVLLPSEFEIPHEGSWQTFAARAVRDLGKVPISEVQFDPTRRQSIDSAVLDRLLSSRLPQTDPVRSALIPA